MKKLLVLLMLTVSKIAMADKPATHGMLIFGDKVTYASHLPMFHAPHDYQVLLQIELQDFTRVSSVEAYKKAKTNGQTLFTIEPEKMDLTQVISGGKTSFTANLYAGHFERGGKFLGQVQVQVSEVIYSQKLDPLTTRQGIYLAFGKEGEYYAAHLISGAPSFDAILRIGQPQKVHKRQCRIECDPIYLPIADQHLPTEIIHTKDLGQVPRPGEELGSSKKAMALSILYSEFDELSH